MSRHVAEAGVLVYGSCVGRDTLEHVPAGRARLVRYVARQSLLSAFSPSRAEIDVSSLSSAFQRRMVQGDLIGSLRLELQRHAPSVHMVLWDLFDERLGAYRTPEGTFVTRTAEALRAGLEDLAAEQSWRLVPFGSDAHYSHWVHALRRFAELCESVGVAGKVVLLDVPWATHTISGAPTPSSYGVTAEVANALRARYVISARNELPWLHVVTVDISAVVADEGHKWGLAPFHFAPSVHRRLATEIFGSSVVGTSD